MIVYSLLSEYSIVTCLIFRAEKDIEYAKVPVPDYHVE